MSKPLITFSFLLLASFAFSQKTQTIKGTVIDKQSQFPLIGANVVVLGTEPLMGNITDVDGNFRIENIPLGRHTIQISYLGYESTVVGNLVLNSAKELSVNISMEESFNQLEEVVISATTDRRDVINQMATVSARTISVEEASRFSGSLADPARMAQNYAGVSGASDDRNDIIIRGNSPTGVLWRMEGINIPSPNHFATLGSTGGPIGMLNINNLSNSDFYTSAWSADYGNALSGVFDLKLRNGNADKREYIGQIGFNGFEIGAEGPFRKGSKASYLINYRYSTLGVFDAIGIDLGTGSAVPQYQDINFKVNVPTERLGTFNLWGIAGKSNIDFKNTGEEDTTNLFNKFEDSRFYSNTAVIGASHTYFVDDKSYTKLTLVGSGVGISGEIDTTSKETGVVFEQFRFNRKQYKLSAHLKFNRKINKKNTFAIGAIYDYYILDMIDSLNTGTSYKRIFDVADGTSLVQSYLNWQYRHNDKLKLNIGLHHQYFGLTNSNAIEPRLGIKYDATPKSSFNIGVGLHSMTQPIITYFMQNDDGVEANRNIGFSKAAHAVFGYDYLITKNTRLKAEIYYQKLYDIPVDTSASSFSFLNTGADFILHNRTGLANEGTGDNYGLELTLEKFFSDGYYFLATGSFFDATYKGSDEVKRNTLFNGGYVLNGLAGKEFNIGKSNSLSFDTKLTYAGGRRYTPINLEASNRFGTAILYEDQAWEKQYNPYFKVDFKISFKLNSKKIAQEWSVDLTNMTDNKNVFQRQYSAKAKTIRTTYQRGFLPIITYKIYF